MAKSRQRTARLTSSKRRPTTLPSKRLPDESISQSRSVPSDLFCNAERDWLEQIADDSGVAYFMTPLELDQLQGPLQLHDTEISIETRCAELAIRNRNLGIFLPTMSLLSAQYFLSVARLAEAEHEIRHKLLAAAGRLICHPSFLNELSMLKADWLCIAPQDRPALPLNQDRIRGEIAACGVKEFVAERLGACPRN